MGKSTKVRFIVSYRYVSFTERCRKTGICIWDTKTNGRPTQQNLERWRKGFNESLINGANSHLNKIHSLIGECWIDDQFTGEERTRFCPPSFEVI